MRSGLQWQLLSKLKTCIPEVSTPLVIFAIVALVGAVGADAGVVRTLDGKSYSGEVSLDASGKLVITQGGKGAAVSVELSNVLYAAMKEDGGAGEAVAGDEPREVVRTEGGALPPGWESTAVGTVGQPVYAKYTDGVFSIKSTDGDLGANGRRDAFCFVKAGAPADVEVVARLMDVKDGARVAAGLVARVGDAAEAPYAGAVWMGGGVRFIKRMKVGERAVAGKPVSGLPIWVRLVRQAAKVTAYTSADGKSWTELGSETLPAGEGQSIGLAVAGRNELVGAHFDSARWTALAKRDTPVTALTPTTYRRGIVLRSGTTLVQVEIESATDAGVKFSKAERREVKVSLANVARIFFRDTPPDVLSRIPAGRPGILLKNGDFMEGTLRAIRDGRIELSSVLFGLQKIEGGTAPYVLVVNETEAPKAELVIRTSDGSVYFAQSAKMEKDRLVIDDESAGAFSLSGRSITHIAAGPGRLEPLANLKASQVDLARGVVGQAAGLSVNSTGVGVPMALGGKPVENGLTLAAGAAATWELGGKYKMLTFRAGVPSGVAPTAAVRFIVMGDGKELYRSAARVSTDAPISGAVDVKGIKLLVLKVEAGTAEIGRMGTPGLFGEASLAK